MPKKKRKPEGPSVTSNVDDQQNEWHTATSDDEESYANEIDSLYKD